MFSCTSSSSFSHRSLLPFLWSINQIQGADSDILLLTHSRLDLGLPVFPLVSPVLPECSHTPHLVVISPQSPWVYGSFSSVFVFHYDFGSLKYWPVILENSPSLGVFCSLSCHFTGTTALWKEYNGIGVSFSSNCTRVRILT